MTQLVTVSCLQAGQKFRHPFLDGSGKYCSCDCGEEVFECRITEGVNPLFRSRWMECTKCGHSVPFDCTMISVLELVE